MKKYNETLTATELAKFAKHNRNQESCFPEYSEFFRKRAKAAETILDCFWGESGLNLLSNVTTTDEEWWEPVDDDDDEPEEDMEPLWE